MYSSTQICYIHHVTTSDVSTVFPLCVYCIPTPIVYPLSVYCIPTTVLVIHSLQLVKTEILFFVGYNAAKASFNAYHSLCLLSTKYNFIKASIYFIYFLNKIFSLISFKLLSKYCIRLDTIYEI